VGGGLDPVSLAGGSPGTYIHATVARLHRDRERSHIRPHCRCMMLHRPRYFPSLFPLSAAFWWLFEYLNRFVQNWYYVGVVELSSFEYVFRATLPFSTVLPAVLGTAELLTSYPAVSSAMDHFSPIRPTTRGWPAGRF